MWPQPVASNTPTRVIFYELTDNEGVVSYHIYSSHFGDWRFSTSIKSFMLDDNGNYFATTKSGSTYLINPYVVRYTDLPVEFKDRLKTWFSASSMKLVTLEDIVTHFAGKLNLETTGSFTMSEYERRN